MSARLTNHVRAAIVTAFNWLINNARVLAQGLGVPCWLATKIKFHCSKQNEQIQDDSMLKQENNRIVEPWSHIEP
jgi:cell division protein FtsB